MYKEDSLQDNYCPDSIFRSYNKVENEEDETWETINKSLSCSDVRVCPSFFFFLVYFQFIFNL